jgi:choline dehydrogenase
VTYIDSKRQRVSAETAYLTPDVLARPNLIVVTDAQVIKVLFDTTGATPIATGVEFVESGLLTSTIYRVHARKEVVVSYVSVSLPVETRLTVYE